MSLKGKKMKNIVVGKDREKLPEIGLGCMRITGLDKNDATKLINTALDNGANFFDHADIYAGGQAESHFADAIGMNAKVRQQIILQTKCSIRKNFFDYSYEYIIESVENSLKRLKTEYIDFLLLHRPDALMEPDEVARAFEKLENDGKVKYFGVSNHNPYQIALLNNYLDNKIIINQLQLSIAHCPIIDAGLNVNMQSNDLSINRDGAVLDYCRLNDITIQAWSPFQYGFFEGVFIGSEKYPELNKVLDRLAEKYNVTNSTIAVAWILRHPAGIQPIVGTTNKQRLIDICKASDVNLTREEWYELYLSVGKKLP